MIVRKKQRLDNYDRELIRYLYNHGAANTNEIADSLKLSWKTVHIHLARLQKLGYVTSKIAGNTRTWELKNY